MSSYFLFAVLAEEKRAPKKKFHLGTNKEKEQEERKWKNWFLSLMKHLWQPTTSSLLFYTNMASMKCVKFFNSFVGLFWQTSLQLARWQCDNVSCLSSHTYTYTLQWKEDIRLWLSHSLFKLLTCVERKEWKSFNKIEKVLKIHKPVCMLISLRLKVDKFEKLNKR